MWHVYKIVSQLLAFSRSAISPPKQSLIYIFLRPLYICQTLINSITDPRLEYSLLCLVSTTCRQGGMQSVQQSPNDDIKQLGGKAPSRRSTLAPALWDQPTAERSQQRLVEARFVHGARRRPLVMEVLSGRFLISSQSLKKLPEWS